MRHINKKNEKHYLLYAPCFIIFSGMLVYILLVNAIWFDHTEREYSTTTAVQRNYLRSNLYKTTQPLLHLTVKTEKFDLTGLGRILFAGSLPLDSLSHYLIPLSLKDIFINQIHGKIQQTKVVPKGTVFKINDLVFYSYEKYFLFFKISSFCTIGAYVQFNKENRPLNNYGQNEVLQSIVLLDDSTNNVDYLLQGSSCVIDIPFLSNVKNNAKFSLRVQNTMIRELLNSEVDLYQSADWYE